MGKTLYRIGLDPDVEKSGYCELSKVPFAGKWTINYMGTLSFFDVIEKLDEVKKMMQLPDVKVLVCIEAGWLNKSIHHVMKGNAHAANIGTRVGGNHQVGKLFVEYCERIGLPYQLYKPTTSKWDAKMFQQVTGVTTRINQEVRDAVRAAWT